VCSKSSPSLLLKIGKGVRETWARKVGLTRTSSTRLMIVIRMIKQTNKWPLLNGSTLPHWVAKSNKLLILGDAAHAMVPYMSQGATMAV